MPAGMRELLPLPPKSAAPFAPAPSGSEGNAVAMLIGGRSHGTEPDINATRGRQIPGGPTVATILVATLCRDGRLVSSPVVSRVVSGNPAPRLPRGPVHR